MKISIIGSGSTYTPEVIEGLLERGDRLGVECLHLYDIDAERLDVVGSFISRMAAHAGAPFEVSMGMDLDEAVSGSDFILSQIRVGGQQARHRDILTGLKHGLIGQETTGVGGFAKAMRTIPVVLDICRRIEALAPGACLINFTNPSGLITEAILNHSTVRAVGLCNIPYELKMTAAKELDVDAESVRLDYVGLNHLAWIRRLFVDGRDVTPVLLEMLASGEVPKNIPDLDYDADLIRALGVFPQYYLRYYYYPGRMLRAILSKDRTRAEEVMEIEAELLDYYRDIANRTKPELLNNRGGAYYSTAAVLLIDAIANDTGAEHIVNVANEGTIPELPDDAVVEVPSLVGSAGAKPLPMEHVQEEILGLIQIVKAYERLTIRAATAQDYRAAYLALLNHPLGPSAENAGKVLDDIIAVNGLSLKR